MREFPKPFYTEPWNLGAGDTHDVRNRDGQRHSYKQYHHDDGIGRVFPTRVNIMAIKIAFPDGGKKEFKKGVTPLEIAKSISDGLARTDLGAAHPSVIK